MVQHIKWPSIESFHATRKAVKQYPHICNGNLEVKYASKIKLHGTNACVQVIVKDDSDHPEMEVVAQSRTAILTPEKDNAGFAAWVKKTEDQWKQINWWGVRNVAKGKHPGRVESVCFFGEWCGPGIQKGTAVNNIPNKIFAVFGMMFVLEGLELPLFYESPVGIGCHMPEVDDTYVLHYIGTPVEIDFSKSADELQKDLDEINKFVEEVEACDPWVKKTFGIEGVGEGLVYYPVSKEHHGRKAFSDLCFKAKGEKHKVVKQKKPVQVDPEVVKSVSEFVELTVTEARLEQGATEACGGEYTHKKIGPFVGWVGKDVSKECQAELEAAGLNWKQVSKEVANKARMWYMNKIAST